MTRQNREHDESREGEEGDVARAGGLLLPGGKVSEEALRRALDEAREARGESGEEGDDDPELRRVTFVLNRDLQKRLDRYLVDRIGFMSRTQLQRLIDEGGVLVNGRVPKSSTVLRSNDTVEVVIPPPPPKNIQPEDIPLAVMYEDEQIIVINKQPDIIVHPARTHLKGTMLSALAYHFKHRSALGGDLSKVGDEFARPGVVHRLDRHTSGCIVFAKQDEAHWKLGHQFEHRRVDKRYLAVIHGWYSPDVEVVEYPIGPHPSREKGYREKYVVRHDELGKHAVTIVRVRERYRIPEGVSARVDSAPGGAGAYSLVELELKTGRTHQIRVHLSHLGYPIVGDDMYGGKAFTDETGREVIARQSLHACTLGIRHPVSDKPLEFTAPLRGDIAGLVHTLRRLSAAVDRPETPGATVDLAKAVGE